MLGSSISRFRRQWRNWMLWIGGYRATTYHFLCEGTKSFVGLHKMSLLPAYHRLLCHDGLLVRHVGSAHNWLAELALWQRSRRCMIRDRHGSIFRTQVNGRPGMLEKASRHCERPPRTLWAISGTRSLTCVCACVRACACVCLCVCGQNINYFSTRKKVEHIPVMLMPMCCKASRNSSWLMHPSPFLSRNRKIFSNLVLHGECRWAS